MIVLSAALVIAIVALVLIAVTPVKYDQAELKDAIWNNININNQHIMKRFRDASEEMERSFNKLQENNLMLGKLAERLEWLEVKEKAKEAALKMQESPTRILSSKKNNAGIKKKLIKDVKRKMKELSQ